MVAARKGSVTRTTKETNISVSVNLDGTGSYEIESGIGFFDHMIEQLAKHSLIDIHIECQGDLHIDTHHTVEDIGWALGQALTEAIGDKIGIHRYGHAYVAMDESLSRAALDLSARPYLIFNVNFTREHLGKMEVECFREFFQAFSQAGGITLHLETLYGENNHHMIESVFKACAKALRMAVSLDDRAKDVLPTTKGAL